MSEVEEERTRVELLVVETMEKTTTKWLMFALYLLFTVKYCNITR